MNEFFLVCKRIVLSQPQFKFFMSSLIGFNSPTSHFKILVAGEHACCRNFPLLHKYDGLLANHKSIYSRHCQWSVFHVKYPQYFSCFWLGFVHRCWVPQYIPGQKRGFSTYKTTNLRNWKYCLFQYEYIWKKLYIHIIIIRYIYTHIF